VVQGGGKWRKVEGPWRSRGCAGSSRICLQWARSEARQGIREWMRGGREKNRVTIVMVRLTVFVARTAGCIYSTFFDAHIRLFSAVRITSIVFPYKTRTIHICIYFRYLAVCITLIENSICIYF